MIEKIASDSRYPKLNLFQAAGSELLPAEIRGKLPRSPHALSDMLDAAADALARDLNMVVRGVASAARQEPTPSPDIRVIVRDYWFVTRPR